MKRILSFVAMGLLVGLTAVPALAQVDEAVRLFDEGNRLYRDGAYADAIRSYQDALSQGYASGPLYHNLGNAYFRTDSLGQSIRFYEKALMLMPANETLLHNIEYARQQRIDQFSDLPVPAWVSWWNRLVSRTGGRGLFWIGILVYFGAIYLVISWIRSGSRNPWMRRTRAIAIAVATLLLIAAFAASVQSSQQKRAVVVAASVPLYDTTTGEVTSSMDIHEGLVVKVLGEQGALTQVQLPNGSVGWVDAEALVDV